MTRFAGPARDDQPPSYVSTLRRRRIENSEPAIRSTGDRRHEHPGHRPTRPRGLGPKGSMPRSGGRVDGAYASRSPGSTSREQESAVQPSVGEPSTKRPIRPPTAGFQAPQISRNLSEVSMVTVGPNVPLMTRSTCIVTKKVRSICPLDDGPDEDAPVVLLDHLPHRLWGVGGVRGAGTCEGRRDYRSRARRTGRGSPPEQTVPASGAILSAFGVLARSAPPSSNIGPLAHRAQSVYLPGTRARRLGKEFDGSGWLGSTRQGYVVRRIMK